ncbi:ATP-binding protein [Coraliomargarita algicola]|uniref:histidine kinase n=1 Tax=Coraliomargarita algicola TaxID=3092156 RepID=A0ABZ0RM07_9BACT|nr:ATP-binding protein [Coraliomargarita sp. J2-16]WPJ95810.1 ATP-binding protein [Coraliomargarita sp. J2-16]
MPTLLFKQPRAGYFAASPLLWLLLVASGIIGGAVVIDTHLERVDLERALNDQREETLSEASILASRIQAETISTFYLVVGLARMIEINGGITDEEFQEICSRLVSSRSGLRNIAAAPDMVVRHVYPLEGNEAALGLDYAKHPTQREGAFKVKETGKPIIAGPFTLVQGGEAVIGRFPVYIRSKENQQLEFWGILSTPFDTGVLYEEAGLYDPSLPIQVNIRGQDASGAKGEIFYGSPAIDQADPVRSPIKLLSGSWEMAAVPKAGWLQVSPNAFYIRTITVIVTVLVLVVIFLYYLFIRRVQHSQNMERDVASIKERFYANMSHELRTPLNGICGMSELIKMSADDKEIVDNASVILQSAQTLTRLLDDVLVLSQSKQLHLYHYREIELDSFLRELVPPLIHQAESKGVAFQVQPIPTDCATITCDPPMLRQILWNLLSNAVKFTHTGEVSLTVMPHSSDQISFHIRDTGIGIDASRIDGIFEAFVQEDASNTRRFGGAGLGLAIVQRFVTQLGGTIQVKSQKNNGSEFIVTLNRAQ